MAYGTSCILGQSKITNKGFLIMDFSVGVLQEQDIDAVTKMEVAAWHEYYSQYETLYDVIKNSVTHETVSKGWHDFLKAEDGYEGKMVTGNDRAAYVAFYKGQPVGIGAVSAYKHGVDVWNPVDDYIRQQDGSLPKLAKYQNLYVGADHRGQGVGHHLNIVRADYMLDRGYTGLFLAPYADATKTMEFHRKNGLEHVHDYMSLSTYKDGKSVKIACCVNLDLRAIRAHWQKQLAGKRTIL